MKPSVETKSGCAQNTNRSKLASIAITQRNTYTDTNKCAPGNKTNQENKITKIALW